MQNTARKLDIQPGYERIQREYEVIKGKKKQNKVLKIKTAMFMIFSVCILACSVTYYLSLQSEITNATKRISQQERKLYELRLDNDENYSRITSNVNLEEVRRVAIQELGMKYAEEGQIISFNGEGSDYVRQTGEIPD